MRRREGKSLGLRGINNAGSLPERVAPSWVPKRAEGRPYTGRGASTIGLLGDRTRALELHIESEIHDVRFFNYVILAFEAKQPLLLYLRL